MSSWTVPGYAFAGELGQHSSGRTVLARHTATGVQVAIRYLADELVADEAYRHRYRARARLLADLDSAHVAALYEYVEADHGVATVREFVVGMSLADLIAVHGALSPEAALSVLKGGLLGLHAGHEAGVTHSAYKPANVLVDVEGRTKLSGFGVIATPPPGEHGAGEQTAGEQTSGEDVAAAMATFVECFAGPRRDAGPALDRVPKRLRGLIPAIVDADGPALLAKLEAVARRAYGDGWEIRGCGWLTKRAVRHARTGRSEHGGD